MHVSRIARCLEFEGNCGFDICIEE